MNQMDQFQTMLEEYQENIEADIEKRTDLFEAI